MKVTAELRDWTKSPGGIYWGRIYNDTKGRWPDGTRIHTSYVKSEIDNGDHLLVVTLNSVYKLQKPFYKRSLTEAHTEV